MLKWSINLLVFSISFSSIAQTELQKLEELQSILDDIQYNIGDGENVDYRKINEEILHFNDLKKESDSLKLSNEILTTELMLVEGKLAVCKNKSNEDELQEGRSTSFVRVHGTNDEKHIEKGYYVVLVSARKFDACTDFLIALEAEAHLNLMIAQNIRKSWYHVCLDKAFTHETVGKQVTMYREKGFSDAWFIYFD